MNAQRAHVSPRPELVPLPTAAEVSELFEMLLGRTIRPSRTSPGNYRPTDHFWCAVYLNGEQKIAGALVFDAQLAMRSAAALSLLPAAQTTKLLEKGELDEALSENLSEICNVATQFFQGPYSSNVRVARIFEVPRHAPPQLFQMMRAARSRQDLRLEIKGYGQGRAAVLML